MLDAFRPEAVDARGLVPIATAIGSADARRVELGVTALGPVYRLTVGSAGTAVLLDAKTGAQLSPLAGEAARAIAVDAAARTRAKERYGAVRSIAVTEENVDVAFAGGAIVSVGRRDLSLSQHGGDTEWIDRLYRIHYLQWTGVPSIDRPFAVIAIVATGVLAALGLWLARPRAA